MGPRHGGHCVYTMTEQLPTPATSHKQLLTLLLQSLQGNHFFVELHLCGFLLVLAVLALPLPEWQEIILQLPPTIRTSGGVL